MIMIDQSHLRKFESSSVLENSGKKNQTNLIAVSEDSQ